MAYVFTINLTFASQTLAQRLLDAYCINHNYDPNSGLTKVQFFKKDACIKPLRESSIRTEPSVRIQQLKDTCNAQIQQILDAERTEINNIIIT